MKKSEVGELLAMIKGLWQEQSTDDLTLKMWVEALEPIPLNAAKELVRQRLRTGMERPSASEVYHGAYEIMGKWEDDRKSKLIGLRPPDVTPEQEKKNKEVLRGIVKELDEKLALRRWR